MTGDWASTPRDFATALTALADPASKGEPGLLHALSGPSASEVAIWTERWPAIATDHRRRLARQMLESAEADFQLDFRRLFEAVLDDPDAEVRATAVDGLWEATDLGLIDRLDGMLAHDGDQEVRARVATALGPFVERGEFEDRAAARVARALEHLVAVAEDEAEPIEVRRRAIESAGYADRDDVRALIGRMLASPTGALRAGALRAMGHSADETWAGAVLGCLEHAEPEIRFEASRAAGELQIEDAVPQLSVLAVEDADRQIRVEAIWALGEIGGPRARRVLERLAERIGDEDDELANAVDDAIATAALTDGDVGWDAFVSGGGQANGADGAGRAARRGAPPLGDDLIDDEDDDALEGDDDLDDWDDVDDEDGDDDEDIDADDDYDDDYEGDEDVDDGEEGDIDPLRGASWDPRRP